VNEIAQFARDVLGAAKVSRDADRILKEAAQHLVSTALHAVDTINEPLVSLALGGRLLEAGTVLRQKVDEMLLAHARVQSRSAIGSPLDGALWLGSRNTPGRYGSLLHIWEKKSSS
jgi:N-acetylglucosamine kinase-like BadF-type ATPase